MGYMVKKNTLAGGISPLQHSNANTKLHPIHFRSYKDDGFALMVQRPGGKLQWTGIVNPYSLEAWLAILSTLIIATIVLGFCLKNSKRNQPVDWTIHFLDALHPLCGRNMMKPGFNAAHLG